MAKEFKVGYKTRNKLQRAIQQDIQRKGLVDTYALKDSVRISAVQGDLNRITLTVNAIYYFMFLDKGADLWNGGVIQPFNIIDDSIKSSLGQQFLTEVVDSYMAWLLAEYPILEVGRIVSEPKIFVRYNLYGDPNGTWNGMFD